MDSKIDFSLYSLSDLYCSAKSIDRDTYPERAKEIDEVIRQREIEQPEEIEAAKNAGQPASRADRLTAAIIDGVLNVLAFIPLVYYMGVEAITDASLPLLAIMFAYGLFTNLILHGYLMHYFRQTIGKHYLSIRIENSDGTQASLVTILIKRMVPMMLINHIPVIGILIAGLVDPLYIFNKQRRCLHDFIANTKVSYFRQHIE